MKAPQSFPIIGIVMLLSALTACKPTPQNDLTKDEQLWIDRTLNGMTIEQKVGQLLAPALAPPRSGEGTDEIELVSEWINKYNIGHLYVTSNRLDPEVTANFINSVQSKADIPLLIHSDLETGFGGRYDGGTILPPLMGLAQARSESVMQQL